jgi:hypothetical protein
VTPQAGSFPDDQILYAGDLQRDKIQIRWPYDAEVKGDGQRVGRLSHSTLYLVDYLDPDLQLGCHSPLSAVSVG